jgi:hypothetical protein
MFTLALRHCRPCNSQRPGMVCWKCGTDTNEVDPEKWSYPELPDVEWIRTLAREVGYAIAEHGSKERDLDLVAIPWTEEAVGVYELVDHLCKNIVYDGHISRVANRDGIGEDKPFGRIAFTISVWGWYKHIDLSVTPREGTTQCAPLQEPSQ